MQHYKLPISKHKIHRELKEKLKVEHSYLVQHFTSSEFEKIIFFLIGYYFYMSKDLMPPYDKKEVSNHLVEVGYKFLVEVLEKSVNIS